MNVLQLDGSFRESLLKGIGEAYGDLSNGALALEKLTLHGTTIGAFILEEGKGILGFSDGKVSMGNDAFDRDYRKIRRVDPHTYLLISGAAGLGVRFARAMRSWVGYLENSVQEPLSARAKIGFLQELLVASMPLASRGMIVQPILATFDHADKGCARLFIASPDGTTVEKNTSQVLGSGYTSGAPLLRKAWKPGLDRETGTAIARDILAETTTNDNASGGVYRFVYINGSGAQTWEEDPDA